MRIVVTNDDGWGAKGLTVLIRQMCRLGEVTVVVPDGTRSSMSNAISVNKRLYMRKLEDHEVNAIASNEEEKPQVFVTNGTPSDCVKLAIHELFSGDVTKIDLLVSGINHGSNSSINIIYSGTMGACFVAAEQGIKAIGFSLCDEAIDADFSFLEFHILAVVKDLYKREWRRGLCYNINAPKGELRGWRFTHQCLGHWAEEIEKRRDEEGREYFWITGYFVNDEIRSDKTDEAAIHNGYLSIQPCTVDMTNYAVLRYLSRVT